MSQEQLEYIIAEAVKVLETGDWPLKDRVTEALNILDPHRNVESNPW